MSDLVKERVDFERLMEQLMTTGSCAGKAEFTRRNNTKSWVIFWSFLIEDARGDPLGVIGIVMDLDACKTILDQLFAEVSMPVNPHFACLR